MVLDAAGEAPGPQDTELRPGLCAEGDESHGEFQAGEIGAQGKKRLA